MEEEVPCYFLCPISLQMMRDPVTLPTGITYDRDGIERWLLTGAGTCPLTKQAVPADCEPTPNHTLRRLIQAWCELHLIPKQPAAGDEIAIRPPTDRARVAALVSRIADAAQEGSHQEQLLAGLRELRDVAAESERNRQLIAAAPGAVDALAAVLVFASNVDKAAVACGCDEALEIMVSLRLSEQRLARVVETNESLVLVDALVSALGRSNVASRERAAQLLADVTAVMSPATNRLASQVFREATQLLRDRPSKAATKAALRVLVGATPWGRNRVKAVDAGAVPALVETLLDSPVERRVCELALAALERLCGCAEGRAELVAHAGGVAAVGARALRVSEAATDKAVRVLRSVSRHAATPAVLQEMAHTGVVAALCLVATEHHQFGGRTRERARETLRLHAKHWTSTSPCLHHHLRAMYPPSSS